MKLNVQGVRQRLTRFFKKKEESEKDEDKQLAAKFAKTEDSHKPVTVNTLSDNWEPRGALPDVNEDSD